MDSLGKFLVKRYGNILIFASPIIGVMVILGVTSNILRGNGASREVQDFIAMVGMFCIFILLCIIIAVRRPLPGILGAWQRRWNAVPTWRERDIERMRIRK